MAILIIIPFAVRFVAGMRVWYGYEPIYQILRLFADYWLCLAIGLTDLGEHNDLLYE